MRMTSIREDYPKMGKVLVVNMLQAVTIPVSLAALLTGNLYLVTGNFPYYPRVFYSRELIEGD